MSELSMATFLEAIRSDSNINVISVSKHRVSAEKLINEIKEDYPEYHDFLKCLATYSAQSWALNCRTKLNINLEYLTNFESDYYFGIENNHVNIQKDILALSDEMMADMRKIIINKKYDALQSVHSQVNSEYSTYLFNKNYKNQLLDACKKYSKRFKTKHRKLLKIYDSLDDELRVAYQDTDYLLRLLPILSDPKRYGVETEYDLAADEIKKCLECLKSYPDNGEILYRILKQYAYGNSILKISKSIGKSRTFTDARLNQGIELIAYILWGYGKVN